MGLSFVSVVTITNPFAPFEESVPSYFTTTNITVSLWDTPFLFLHVKVKASYRTLIRKYGSLVGFENFLNLKNKRFVFNSLFLMEKKNKKTLWVWQIFVLFFWKDWIFYNFFLFYKVVCLVNLYIYFFSSVIYGV